MGCSASSSNIVKDNLVTFIGRSGKALTVDLRPSQDFVVVNLYRDGTLADEPESLGMRLLFPEGKCFYVQDVKLGGLVPSWNKKNADYPQAQVWPGDIILSVNGASLNAVKMLREIRKDSIEFVIRHTVNITAAQTALGTTASIGECVTTSTALAHSEIHNRGIPVDDEKPSNMGNEMLDFLSTLERELTDAPTGDEQMSEFSELRSEFEEMSRASSKQSAWSSTMHGTADKASDKPESVPFLSTIEEGVDEYNFDMAL